MSVTFLVSPPGNVHEANSWGDTDALGLSLLVTTLRCTLQVRAPVCKLYPREPPDDTQAQSSRQLAVPGSGGRCKMLPAAPLRLSHTPGEARGKALGNRAAVGLQVPPFSRLTRGGQGYDSRSQGPSAPCSRHMWD